jgi:hypothetical protein
MRAAENSSEPSRQAAKEVHRLLAGIVVKAAQLEMY